MGRQSVGEATCLALVLIIIIILFVIIISMIIIIDTNINYYLHPPLSQLWSTSTVDFSVAVKWPPVFTTWTTSRPSSWTSPSHERGGRDRQLQIEGGGYGAPVVSYRVNPLEISSIRASYTMLFLREYGTVDAGSRRFILNRKARLLCSLLSCLVSK